MLLSAFTGCKHDATKDAPPSVAELPLPPAPAGMLGYARFGTPDATWSALQKSFGTVAGFLPGRWRACSVRQPGMDADITSMADGAAPAFALVGTASATSDGPPPWVVVFRVRDAVRAAGILTSGTPPRYGMVPGLANGLQMYTRAAAISGDASAPALPSPDATDSSRAAFGLTADKIVFASDEAALTALGPYAARVLPTLKYADGAIVLQADHAALAGPLHDGLAAEWADLATLLQAQAKEAQQAHGRPADFGDPEATQRMMTQWAETDLAVVPDLDHVSLALDVDDGAIVAHAVATALGSDANSPAHALMQNLTTCDFAPLAKASLDAFVAGFVCHKAASDAGAAGAAIDVGSASDVATALEAAMGPRLTAADVTSVRAAFGDASKAFGGWTRVEILPTLDVRLDAPTTDAALAIKATRELVTLLKIPAFGGPLESALHTGLGTVTDGAAQFEPTAAAKGSAPAPAPAPATGTTPASDHRYKAEWKSLVPGELAIAFGARASALLEAPPATATLTTDADAARSLARLGPNGSFALVVHPGALLESLRKPGESSHAGAVLGWGKRGNDVWMTTSLDAPLVRQIARALSGM